MPDYDAALEYKRVLTETRLACGKSLIELTTFDDIAMWWFVDFGFVDQLGRLLGRPLPERKTRQAKYRVMKVYKRVEGIPHALLKATLAVVITILEREMNGAKNQSKRVFFTAQDVEWRVMKSDQGRTRRTDVFFDSMLQGLVGKCQCVGVFPVLNGDRIYPSDFNRSMRILVGKLRNWCFMQRPLEVYWSPAARHAEVRASVHFTHIWLSLKQDAKFVEICRDPRREAGGWIEVMLEHYFRFTFPRAVRYMQMATQMVRKEKPNLLLLVNEYGFFERALVVAGRLLDVPTLAIQHGELHSYHAGYMYMKKEIATDGSVKSPYCPIPDKTAVFGPRYKELLTELSAYPSNSVIVTGQPRYDRLAHARRIYSREVFMKRYRIPASNKILLWATECDALTMDENVRNFRAVFEVMQDFDGVSLVIKQHPAESEAYTTMIKQYCDEYRLDAVLTPSNSDLYEQLFACDLLLSKSSTSVVEAVALNKPVIVLNLTGENDPYYVREGIALGVHKQAELEPAVRQLLSDDSSLASHRAKFIDEYLHKMDGKSTERAVALTLEMLGLH